MHMMEKMSIECKVCENSTWDYGPLLSFGRSGRTSKELFFKSHGKYKPSDLLEDQEGGSQESIDDVCVPIA